VWFTDGVIPKEAIERAIEKGWKPAGKECTGTVIDAGYSKTFVATEGAIEGARYFLLNPEIALDPSFWQCLGKVLGWHENKQIKVNRPRAPKDVRRHMIDVEENYGLIVKMNDREIVFEPYQRGKRSWNEHARTFYDVALTGGDIKRFWDELLK
jgi:hypothetical protein